MTEGHGHGSVLGGVGGGVIGLGSQIVGHGQPLVVIANHEVAISAPWSMHFGVGTSNYGFIWGMAGENLNYGDMDIVKPNQLK